MKTKGSQHQEGSEALLWRLCAGLVMRWLVKLSPLAYTLLSAAKPLALWLQGLL